MELITGYAVIHLIMHDQFVELNTTRYDNGPYKEDLKKSLLFCGGINGY